MPRTKKSPKNTEWHLEEGHDELPHGDMSPVAQDVLAQQAEAEAKAQADLDAQEVNTEDSIAAMGTLVEMATAGIPLPGVDVMRAENEALGAEIKATRTQWRATGINKTKKRVVLEMLVNGTTKTNIVAVMGITPTAAGSLFGDIRAMGIKIDREGDVYSVARGQLMSVEAFSDLAYDEEDVQLDD